MKIIDWLGNFLTPKKDSTINFETFRMPESAVAVQAYSLFVCIDLVATISTKCSFGVFDEKGQIKKSALWVMLNVKPNKNQNAYEFWHELVAKLLYYGEVLVLQKKDQLIIADSFTKEEYALKDDIFSNVTRGNFTFNGLYGSSKVLHLKLRNTDISQLVRGIFQMYEELLNSATTKYHRGKYEKGILKVSAAARGANDFEKNFETLMNDYFKAYFQSGNAVLPMFDGYEYVPGTAESTKKYSNEITDIVKLFEESLSRAAQALKIPVSLVRGDVASIGDAYDILLSNCVDPIAKLVSCELTGKFYTVDEIAGGAGVVMQTKNIKHVDVFSIAGNMDKLIASGITSIDECRVEAGWNALNEDWSQQHFITKNYATANGLEDGAVTAENKEEKDEPEGKEDISGKEPGGNSGDT